MRVVDFHALSRPVQDRFVDATKGRDQPRPLLSRKGAPSTAVPWIALSVVAAALLVVVRGLGFGDLGSSLALHGVALVVVYAALAAAVLVGLIQATASRARARALPFDPGIYVFPTCAVDARTHLLRVFPIAEAKVSPGPPVQVAFGADHFAFPVSGDAAAAAARATQLAQEQAAAGTPGGLDDEAPKSRRIEIDPLAEPSFVSPLSPTDPLPMFAPAWIKVRFVLCAAIGAGLGFLVWQTRNGSSDERMYAEAKQRGDVATLHAYLGRGVRHRDEVARVLLPRAELRVAQDAGTVEAIERYIAEHPGSAIQVEVDAALRKAMLDELARAQKPGTLASLDAFAKAHPAHGLDPELAAAVHGVYRAALGRFKAEAGKDAKAIESVEKLLAWAEKKGGRGAKVTVRFQRKASTSLGRADKVVSKHANFHGEVSNPTRYFDAAHFATAEADLGKALTTRFAAAFPAEILTFDVGAPLEDKDPPPPGDRPTVVVAHAPEWLGVAHASTSPHGIFVGLTFVFEVTFTVPGTTEPLRFKQGLAKGVPFDVLAARKNATDSVILEEAVYSAMTREAFLDLGKRYLGTFFATP